MLAYANKKKGDNMNLYHAEIGKECIIKSINTNDEELNAFLFSLGCYSGEPITVISKLRTCKTISEINLPIRFSPSILVSRRGKSIT